MLHRLSCPTWVLKHQCSGTEPSCRTVEKKKAREEDPERVFAVNKNVKRFVCTCTLKISTTETSVQQLQQLHNTLLHLLSWLVWSCTFRSYASDLWTHTTQRWPLKQREMVEKKRTANNIPSRPASKHGASPRQYHPPPLTALPLNTNVRETDRAREKG